MNRTSTCSRKIEFIIAGVVTLIPDDMMLGFRFELLGFLSSCAARTSNQRC